MDAQKGESTHRWRELRGMLLAFIGVTCWGFSATCVSYLVDRNGVSVPWLADARLFIAGGLFLAYVLVRDRDRLMLLFRSRTLLMHMVAYTLVAVVLMQVGYMNAIKYTNAGTALLLMELSVPFVLIYECVKGRRRPARLEIIALVLALFGVFCIATQGNMGSLGINALGLMFGLMAAVANAGYILIPVRLVRECGTLVVNAVGMLLAAIILLPFGRPWEVPATMDGQAWLVFAAVVALGTMLAYVIFLKAIADAGTVKCSLIGVFEPGSGAVTSALWLGTVFSAWDFLGGAAIIAMMVLVALSK